MNVSGSDLELVLKSASTGYQLQNADYESGHGSDTLKFTYTVQPGDNGADIDVDNLKLNSSTIKGSYGNDVDLSIPLVTILSTQEISVDTLRLFKSYSKRYYSWWYFWPQYGRTYSEWCYLSSFHYKAAISAADCKNSSGYLIASNLNPVAIDVSSFVPGEVHICATGVTSSGYTQDYSIASSVSFNRDTTCGTLTLGKRFCQPL